MQRASTPKNEKPAVTIANLERENDNLAARIDELSKRNIDMEIDRNQWCQLANTRTQDLLLQEDATREWREKFDESQAKIAKLESVLCGYRQAIADVHHGHGGEIK